jgi:DivIVA domain-containing protein
MEGKQEGPRPARPPQSSRQRSVRPRQSRHRGAVDRVREVQFPLVLRGYDRAAVDAHLAEVAQLVAELEATQLRENVVQRALDEVGEQTSGILQHAHETAEEIAARSRSQAEGRIHRAEHEAAQIRHEAERYREQVAADTRRMTEERRRLIEELRQYAEEVLGVADDALERLPELLAGAPEGEPETPAAEPTEHAAAQPTEHAAAQPTEQLPAPEEAAPPPQAEPAPEPKPAPQAEPASQTPPEDDEIVEGVLRVERMPKRGSS